MVCRYMHSLARPSKLTATQVQLNEVSALLDGKKTLLTEAQVAAEKAHNIDLFEKTKELRTLTSHIHAAKAELAGLKAEVKDATARRDEVLASIEDLRKQWA